MSARQPFVPKRSGPATEQSQSEHLVESQDQSRSMDIGSNFPIDKPLNVSGLIKSSNSSKEHRPIVNVLNPRGSFSNNQRVPRPTARSATTKPTATLAQAHRQAQKQNPLFSNSTSSPFNINSISNPSSNFQPIPLNNPEAYSTVMPAMPPFQLRSKATSTSNPSSVFSHKSTYGENPAHIRTSAFTPSTLQDPFVPESASQQTQGDFSDPNAMENSSPSQPTVGLGLGLGLGVAVDANGSPSLRSAINAGSGSAQNKRDRSGDDESGEDGERAGMALKRRKDALAEVRLLFNPPCVRIYANIRSQMDAQQNFSPLSSNQHQHQQQRSSHYYREPSAMTVYDNETEELDGQQPTSHNDPPADTRPSSRASSAPLRNTTEISALVARPEPAPAPEQQVFQTILGVDVNAHVLKQMEDYETNKRKWDECTTEEWEAGGDGACFVSSVDP